MRMRNLFSAFEEGGTCETHAIIYETQTCSSWCVYPLFGPFAALALVELPLHGVPGRKQILTREIDPILRVCCCFTFLPDCNLLTQINNLWDTGIVWWCPSTTQPEPSLTRGLWAWVEPTCASTPWTPQEATNWWGEPCPSGTPSAVLDPSPPPGPGCCASLTRSATDPRTYSCLCNLVKSYWEIVEVGVLVRKIRLFGAAFIPAWPLLLCMSLCKFTQYDPIWSMPKN